jgi:hypothetical protein
MPGLAPPASLMGTPPTNERLAERQYITLILRLLLDPAGNLVHGEVGAVEREMDWIRFTGSDGLQAAIEAWLARSRQERP